MTIYRNFVAVSYSEFQYLYNYGEIVVTAGRLVAIPLNDSGEPLDELHYSATLLDRAPACDPNDEEGILLLCISEVTTAKKRNGYFDPGLLSLSFSSVEKVVPLGERSFRILGGRLREMGVKLSQPFFKMSARIHRLEKIMQSSQKAGRLLVSLLLGDNSLNLSEQMLGALDRALYKTDYLDSEDRVTESVLPTIFGYTRHEPVHNSNTDCIEDLGICISTQYGQDSPVVADYRHAFGAVKDRARKPGCTLVDVLSDVSFDRVLRTLEKQYAQYFPWHPVSMTIFLKWKDKFHRSNDSLDLEALREECQELVNVLNSELVGQSLWLLGSYIGHDRMATLLYSTTTDDLPIFEGVRCNISPISCRTQESTEAGTTAPDVVSDMASVKRVDGGNVDAEPNDTEHHHGRTDSVELPMTSEQSSDEMQPKDTTESTLQSGSGTGEISQNPSEKTEFSSEPCTTSDEAPGLAVQPGHTGQLFGDASNDDEISSPCSSDGTDTSSGSCSKDKQPAKADANQSARKTSKIAGGDSPRKKPGPKAKRVAKNKSAAEGALQG